MGHLAHRLLSPAAAARDTSCTAATGAKAARVRKLASRKFEQRPAPFSSEVNDMKDVTWNEFYQWAREAGFSPRFLSRWDTDCLALQSIFLQQLPQGAH
jgi:hypothetical protein